MKKFVIVLLCVLVMLGIFCNVYASTKDEVIEVVKAAGIMNGDENGSMNFSSYVTRAEFTKMLVCASKYKDSVSNEVYYSPFCDVIYSHWASSYVQIATEQGWVNGYLDGTFRPNNNISLEEAVTIILKMLGYTTNDFVGAYPYAQLNLYNSLNINTNVIAKQGEKISRQDAMYLIYNMLNTQTKNGQIYSSTIGYSQNENGEIDINKLISNNIKGPYIVESTIDELGLNLANVEVEKNGMVSSVNDIQKYDVIYYSKNLNKVWVYSKTISGTYQNATPSISSPTSIIISGVTYSIETTDAKYALSLNGKYHVGEVVTVLMGREGIVKVMLADEYSSNVYGIVAGISIGEYTTSLGNKYSARTISVKATDGNTYSVECKNKTYEVGALVKINYETLTPNVSRVSEKSLKGQVTNDKIGSFSIVPDIQIIDVKGSEIKKVFLSRIIGSVLTTADVKYYTTNSKGEINNLILNDFTGDFNVYGILTSLSQADSSKSLSGTYTYQVGGKTSTINTKGKTFSVNRGAIAVNMEGNNAISMTNLNEMKNVDRIEGINISNASQTMILADDVDVYLKYDSVYYSYSLNEIISNLDEYTIKAYYDDSLESAGRVRLIIVEQ